MNVCFVENTGVAYNKFYRTIEGQSVKHTQSSIVRVLNVAKTLRKFGHQARVISVINMSHDSIIRAISESDIVIFHRIQGSKYTWIDHRYISACMLARQYRKKIVFDVDDAIHLTFPCFAEYIANCSKVFAGSHALIDYYKRFSKNVTLIPSSVDTDVIRPLSHLKSSATVIGWHGSAFGHLENLNLISSVFKKLSSKFDLVFRILGTAGNLHLQQILLRRFEGVRLEFGPDYWFAYEQLPHYMATVDIAVYPLVNTYWNRSKCSMKLLEYMAMELPSCSSRVGENAYIVSDGLNGFLASNQDEWMVRLKRLIDDKELRIDMGKKAKAQVDKTYSVERVSQEISDLIENA